MGLWEDLKSRHSYKSLGSPRISIGIPTINQKELLVESLNDISKNLAESIHTLIIIDNGHQSIDEIIPSNLKPKTTVYTEEKNLGVSGSWNKIINKTLYCDFPADHLLLLNDDVVFGKTIEDILKVIDDHPEYTLINCKYYWSVFLITKECIDDVGYFDDKFFPAYFEVNDFGRRHSIQYNSVDTKWRFEHSGLDPIIKRNSSTIRKDPSLNSFFGRNANYYHKKWGGGLGHERWLKPFNGQPQEDD